MTPAQYRRAKDVFLEACDLPARERVERVLALAGDDALVRDHALRLLEHDGPEEVERADEQLRQGLEALLDAATGAAAEVPGTIGRYRVIGRVGAGGMGDVFEAEQETPRRRVAIKLMRSGLGSEAMVRRFRREVEFLGRLAHPGIAQVYDAGVAEMGGARVPYYVMELVDGKPLTAFAAERGLDRGAKLRLFASVCDAVQYAHQQGIIHRDLKPANILVQEVARGGTGGGVAGNGAGLAGMVRILDFGIARAVDAGDGTGESRGVQGTLATEAGQIFGTIPYMSPEQIGGCAGEIDTRTDVYALGVLLFEMLTGRLPHRTEGLSLVEAAGVKSGSPARLSAGDRSLAGDLETIVGKALEPEKARRYGSASELASDVRRFMSDEVISARPATAVYQFRKFARRNRAVVGVGIVAVLALAGGVVGTALQARAAFRERDVADRKTAVAEAVSQVLLDALTMATPKGLPGREARLIDAIEQTEARARDEALKMSPEVRAVVLNIVGIIHRERGSLERAEAAFSKALEIRRAVLSPDDPNLADSLNNLGLLRRKQERFAEAAVLMREAVEVQRRSSFPDEGRLARNIYNLASAYISAGEPEKARPLLDESLAMHRRLLGENHEVIGLHYVAFARLAKGEGRWDAAQVEQERALALYRRCVGPDHPSIATALRDLAAIAARNGNQERAIELLREADAMGRKVFPVEPPHPDLQAIRRDLLEMLRAAGRGEEAERLGELTGAPR